MYAKSHLGDFHKVVKYDEIDCLFVFFIHECPLCPWVSIHHSVYYVKRVSTFWNFLFQHKTLSTSGFAYNFEIFVKSERVPSLPGSNTASFGRFPDVSKALKFGFSWSLVIHSKTMSTCKKSMYIWYLLSYCAKQYERRWRLPSLVSPWFRKRLFGEKWRLPPESENHVLSGSEGSEVIIDRFILLSGEGSSLETAREVESFSPQASSFRLKIQTKTKRKEYKFCSHNSAVLRGDD